VLLVLLLLSPGLAIAQVQGYRLVIPGDRMPVWAYAFLPWSMWEEQSSHATFIECETARTRLRTSATRERQDMNNAFARLTATEAEQLRSDRDMQKNMTFLRKVWARQEHAECWGIR
jgi:hypothetical protein